MHGLQHCVVRADAARRLVRNIPELPFGPNWVPPEFWRDKIGPGKRRGGYDQPRLELPLEEPPMHRRAPAPLEKSDRGVVIIQIY